MKWPWAELERLRTDAQVMAQQLSVLQRDAGEMRETLRQAKGDRDAARENTAAAERRSGWLESEVRRLEKALKAHETPEGHFYECHCGSNRTHVIRHITGWKPGDERANPVLLGATVQCVDCGRLYHVDNNGMSAAKPVPKEREEREKRKPADSDGDLRWGGRRK